MQQHPSTTSGRSDRPVRRRLTIKGSGLALGSRRTKLASVLLSSAVVFGLLQVVPALPAQAAPPATCGSGCSVTVDARDFASDTPLANFTYAINLDNTKLPTDPNPLSTESFSPIVREGDQSLATVTLPDGRYMMSVRAPDHKMWGAYFTLPTDAAANGKLTEHIALTTQSADNPLPLGKIRVFVFNDNTWTNGAPDTEEGGLRNFKIGLEEQTHLAVTVDYNNKPLCGGDCLTGGDGFVQVDDLGPATYFIDVHPPVNTQGPHQGEETDCSGARPGVQHWTQTTTIDGGLQLMAPTEEGADGTGAPGEQLWEPPDNRTAYWFGFVCGPQPLPGNGTGEITGTARNWVEWAPYTTGTFDQPVENPFIALSDSTSDQTVYVGQGDAAGNFDIQNVPAGQYNLSIWDEQLSYIMRFKPVTVAGGQVVDVNDTGDNGEVGIGVSRWFGFLDGHVYKDLNGNGKMDPGEPTIPNTDMDQRWRDGSIKESTFTNTNGYYQYPTNEGGPLGRWVINEQGFARFSSYPGPSVHDEITGAVTPSCDFVPPALAPANPCIPVNQGGGLLTNLHPLEGHTMTVDWGKRDYAPGTPGQIVGITYFATTRNEFEAKNQAHEDYEPAVPDVTVLLEGLGLDGLPNTMDDTVLNKYVTDHWQQPNASQDLPLDPNNSFRQSCNPIRDFTGADITSQFNPDIGPNCLEVPLGGQQTKDGAFDGGYAFADYCPNGYDLSADECVGGVDPVPLVAGTYITHAVMPVDSTDTRDCNGALTPTFPVGDLNVSTAKTVVPGGGTGCLYRPVKEEDVNVDLGNHFAPAIPPPDCTGDMHVIDQSTLTPRSHYYTGNQSTSPSAPLCDKRLVVLTNGQNANADFNMMTNFPTDPNGKDPNALWSGDVPEPGRLVGQVFNDIYFERNPLSNWYGEPRPIAGIPVGIYARVDTVCPADQPGCGTPNVNKPYDPNHWRLLTTVTTSLDGSFEALVPSTETLNCPIPQGPCPGMYLVTVDDPGTIQQPNANFNPNLLIATTPAEAWPGLTDQLDLPLDPISGTACDFSLADGTATAIPELLQVSRPYVNAGDSGAARQITIQSDFIGTSGPLNATGGKVTLTDANGSVTTLTQAPGGGVMSWTPGSGNVADQIVIQVPAVGPNFPAGPKQLNLVSANASGAVSSVNGITLHVLGAGVPARIDAANTFDGTVVFDPAVTTGDVGRLVSGAGIPNNTHILSVVATGPAAQRRFTMDKKATQTGDRSITITRVDNPVTIHNNSHLVSDTAITTADLGRSVTFSGGGGLGGTRTIVNPLVAGTSFTVSGGNANTTATRIATITKTDPSAFINNGTFVLDPAVLAGDVGGPVTGLGVPASTTVVSQLSTAIGSGFVVSNAATATSYPATVSLAVGAGSPSYTPKVVNVPPPPPIGPPANAHALQDAIDNLSNPAGSLLVLSPGTYNENIVMWRPMKIQGVGPGGIIGTHELQGRDPEDPRFNIPGSVIDGRFFQQNATTYDATVATHAPYVLPNFTSNLPSTVLRGADITVVAQFTDAYGSPAGPTDLFADSTARIDGLGLTTGRGEGAGGIQLQASANHTQLTNNVLENNGGIFAGGIGVGQPFVHQSHNFKVNIAHNRVLGNGGLTTSGGMGIFYDSNNYSANNNILCSNFSVEYGAGISHIGLSDGGNISDNQIFYNDSVDSGAGIAIESELPNPRPPSPRAVLGDGTGSVNVDRNLIQSNYSGDDGGGLFVLDALANTINVRNNMIVDNGASDIGGAMLIDDSSDVRIINNTIANNVTTGASENSLIGVPHSAGLASEANEPAWQNAQASSAPHYSRPTALFNNIFWNNQAYTLDHFGPGATLISQGFIDLEVHGTGNFNDRLTPRFSDITANSTIAGNGATRFLPALQGNVFGVDPNFVEPFILELAVSGSRLDPQAAAVTITGQDPPVGLSGNYHLLATSPLIDIGVRCSNTLFPVTGAALNACTGSGIQAPLGVLGDFDRQYRPQRIFTTPTSRFRTPWDLGADEVPGTPVTP